MLCEKCKKKTATVFYEENINGKETVWKVCKDCAAELSDKNGLYGFDAIFGDSSWSDPFKSMNSLLSGIIGSGKPMTEKRCPGCGMIFKELAANGMAGCPECYTAFAKELEPTIAKLHGHVTHRGRVPSRFREKQALKDRIASLEKEREEAVRDENYERAAQIRDELKNLRTDENAQ